MTRTLRFAFAAPLALAIAACNSGTEEAGTDLSGDVVETVAAPDGTSWSEQVAVSDADGYVLGNPDAPIKLVEYASLTCPACKAFAATGMEPLISEYVDSGRVSFELRNQIHGPHDLVLATLVRCGADEAYHPLSDQVWANLESLVTPIIQNQTAVEQALSQPPEQRFISIAQIGGYFDFFAQRGISEDQARTCLADVDTIEGIARNSTEQSNELGISGTPTFLINGRQVEGVNSWESLEPALQDAGAR